MNISAEKMMISGADKMMISDDELFRDPPPKEDCSICMLPMPFANELCGVKTIYMPCCGKTLCKGCVISAEKEMNEGNMKRWCPFCRLILPERKKEFMKRIKKRMDVNDAQAYLQIGLNYYHGLTGLTQDREKALELFNKAAELGSIEAYFNIALTTARGEVIGSPEKALHYMSVAAIGGHEVARHNLGLKEETSNGSMERAMKHYIIAARCGYDKSLKKVGEGYKAGHVTKDEYANTLRAYQATVNQMKSKERDNALLVYLN